MNDAATGLLPLESRSASLALASVVAWLAAAASTGPLGIWVAIGGTAIALGLAVLLFERPASTALLLPSPRLVLLGAAAGSVMAVATYLLYPLLARTLPFIATDTTQLYAAFRAPSLVVASVAIVPVIVGEELVWRGVVQASLSSALDLGEASRWQQSCTRWCTRLSARPCWWRSLSSAGSRGALCAPRQRVSFPPWWLTYCGTHSSCSGCHWTPDEERSAQCLTS